MNTQDQHRAAIAAGALFALLTLLAASPLIKDWMYGDRAEADASVAIDPASSSAEPASPTTTPVTSRNDTDQAAGSATDSMADNNGADSETAADTHEGVDSRLGTDGQPAETNTDADADTDSDGATNRGFGPSGVSADGDKVSNSDTGAGFGSGTNDEAADTEKPLPGELEYVDTAFYEVAVPSDWSVASLDEDRDYGFRTRWQSDDGTYLFIDTSPNPGDVTAYESASEQFAALSAIAVTDLQEESIGRDAWSFEFDRNGDYAIAIYFFDGPNGYGVVGASPNSPEEALRVAREASVSLTSTRPVVLNN